MTVGGIESIGALTLESNSAMTRQAQPFESWMSQELQNTNHLLNSSEIQLQKLATGEAESIHHVMLALEEANTSFQLMVQVRNKLLDGYKEIMRMQV
jgi:flagellar hook-basal body complex protein FliE